MLKHPTSTKEIFRWQNSVVISREVPPISLLDVFAGDCQKALVNKSGMIRTQMGTNNRSEMVAVQG
jgi:hypothetical protein